MTKPPPGTSRLTTWPSSPPAAEPEDPPEPSSPPGSRRAPEATPDRGALALDEPGAASELVALREEAALATAGASELSLARTMLRGAQRPRRDDGFADGRTLPSPGATAADATPAPGAPADLVGQVLHGKYRVDELLGQGGMGQVFRGFHLGLRTPVAVKLMHASLAATESHVRRFQREAEAAARLRHPNVVQVLDFGIEAGCPFIVMELLTGETLGDYLDAHREPPPLDEVATILLDVCGALEAAHELGIVHRDLKPDNIFLARDALGARAIKVVDFGLAHVDAPDGGERLTQTGVVAGSPHYMSPEQCHSLAVGPSTDIYALGCLLTELLQLAPPFGGQSSTMVMAKQMFMPAPELARPPGCEPVPPLLERLRSDLLAKAPERRPASAAKVAQRLRGALDPDTARRELPARSGSPADRDRSQRQSVQPAAPPSASAPSTERRAVAVARAEGATAVDDRAIVALAAHGIDVNHAAGASALVYDAGADIEAAEAFLQARRDVPVLVCLADATIDRIQRLIRAGAADLVGYPVAPDVLVKRLGRVLRRRR